MASSCIASASLLLAACNGDVADAYRVAVPVIDSEWTDITGVPDLGAFNAPGQQPVDFGAWRAADEMWHLWSCIRFTNVGGNSRLFYEWTSASLTAPNWTPVGIAMRADPAVGEYDGGLQAPHVFREAQFRFHMFYGAWQSICSATSDDGITFTRTLDANGQCPLFTEGPDANTRDPMVLRVGDHWQVVYTAFTPDGQSPVYARTSRDLQAWSESRVISKGVGESPFVVAMDDSYLLFKTTAYGVDARTEVYQGGDSLHFDSLVATLPVASPEIVVEGTTSYIIAFKPNTDGMRIARLRFDRID